jgi:HPt (histidine-containing phosphotransfer) domain-containing protein
MSVPAIDPVVFARLREITGDDPDFLAELVDTYLEDGDAQVRALREAPTGDLAALVRPAHSLKSSSASVGATALAERCRVLEADARAGQVDDVDGTVHAIAEEFAAVATELAAMRAGGSPD